MKLNKSKSFQPTTKLITDLESASKTVYLSQFWCVYDVYKEYDIILFDVYELLWKKEKGTERKDAQI